MIAFVLAVFLLVVTPGPGVLSTAGVGAAFGWRQDLFYIARLWAGTNLGGVAVISGLAAIILTEPLVRTVLLFASSSYLGYLALQIALAGTKIAFIQTAVPGFIAGLMLALINPKAYAVNTTLFTSFGFYPDSFASETALKLIIFNIVWLPTHLVWLYAGVKLNSLNLSARTQRLINLLLAACLLAVVGLSVWSVLMLSPGVHHEG